MPPTPNNVDGIKPPATAPTGPPQRPQAPEPASAEPQPTSSHNTVDLQAAAADALQQSTLPKANPKVSKKNHGPVFTILLTLVIMVALIGLAYFVYNKSK